MNIREVQEKDLADIKDIYSHYFTDERDLDYFFGRAREALNKTDLARERDFHYFVAETDSKVVGFIGFRKPAKKLLPFTRTAKPVELYSLFVKEKSKGIGRLLVDFMIKKVSEFGYTEVVVYSSVKFEESWGFYDKLGFTRVGKLLVGGNGQVWTMFLK